MLLLPYEWRSDVGDLHGAKVESFSSTVACWSCPIASSVDLNQSVRWFFIRFFFAFPCPNINLLTAAKRSFFPKVHRFLQFLKFLK